jgi:MFS transporter, ACS family, D-galactonate transporter
MAEFNAAPTAPAPATAREATRIRWWFLALCFVALAINYVDRASLGVAAPAISKDLHLGPAALGVVLSGFFWSYALAFLPMGYLLDRFGIHRAYPVTMGWWSIFSGSTALANSMGALFGTRFLMGIGEASSLPASAKVVASWFPKRERAFATAIWDNGVRIGLAIAFPIVAFLTARYGWRSAFIITGAFGLFWALVWFAAYRDPDESAHAAELAYASEGRTDDPEAQRLRWPELFRHRTTWGMMLGFFCSNIVNYFFLTWFPSYLVSVRHFTLLKVGTIGAIPAVAAILGGLLGGYTADRLYRAGWSLTRARKTCLVGSLIVSSLIAPAAAVGDPTLSIALFAISYAAIAFNGANINALPPEVAPSRRHVASLSGIQAFGGNLAGILTSTFTGLMVAITHGSFVVPITVAGVFAFLGALTYLFVVGPIEPLRIQPREPRLERGVASSA